ncbi:MAG: hypothetical protein K5851_07215 [Lachnospiraceae bacterium]|nr:hypothetical protein [Lachnospiraceae bacterium]
MILKSCYITGFGRLRDFEYKFSDGLNTIFEENGWGKTTFSVFIKSMFYGLIYSPNSKSLTERKHYLPWDGGVFGGSLVFETSKGVFRVERYFGEKGSEDTFKLYDEETGRETDIYTENLGEEIFGVDQESFEKTIFIGQTDISTSITDKINAKVGNLSQTRDDLDEFEAAVARIEEARKSLKSRRKNNPGKLDVISDEIRDLKIKTEEIPPLYEAYRSQQEIFKNREATILDLRLEKTNLKKEISIREKNAEKSGVLQAKSERLDSDNERLSKLDLFFVNGSPSDEDIDEYDELIQKYSLDNRSLESKTKELLSEEEENRIDNLFSENLPSEADIDNWQADADRIKELRMMRDSSTLGPEDEREMKMLREFFQKGRPEHDEITNLLRLEGQISTLAGQEKAILENMDKVENDRRYVIDNHKSNAGGRETLYSILTVVLAVGALVFLLMFDGRDTELVSIIFGVLSGIFALLFILRKLHLKNAQKLREARVSREMNEVVDRLEAVRGEIDELKSVSKSFFDRFDIERNEDITEAVNEVQRKLDRLEHLEKLDHDMMEKSSGAIEELSAKQLSLYTSLHNYAESYGMDLYHEMNEIALLKELREDLKKKKDNDKEKGNVSLLKNRVDLEKNDIENFLNRYNYEAVLEEGDDINEWNYTDKISSIRQNQNVYLTLQEEVESLTSEILALKEELPDSTLNAPIEELQERDAQLDEMIATNLHYYDQDQETLNDIADQIVSLEDDKDRIVGLEEIRKQYEKKVKILDAAKDYLKMARDKFMAEYMGPLQKKMVYYLDQMYPDKDNSAISKDFELDMDLKVRFKYRGRAIGTDYLSEGYKDMVSLSVRFALIDAMYEKEQPVVFLDDPFTSFDDDKIKEGLSLLDRVSSNRQIIYFTCHTSRALEEAK